MTDLNCPQYDPNCQKWTFFVLFTISLLNIKLLVLDMPILLYMVGYGCRWSDITTNANILNKFQYLLKFKRLHNFSYWYLKRILIQLVNNVVSELLSSLWWSLYFLWALHISFLVFFLKKKITNSRKITVLYTTFYYVPLHCTGNCIISFALMVVLRLPLV